MHREILESACPGEKHNSRLERDPAQSKADAQKFQSDPARIDEKNQEAQKCQIFLPTDPQQWEDLDIFEKYILAMVDDILASGSEISPFSEISNITRVEEFHLKWHWRKLIKGGFLTEKGHEITINPKIKTLIKDMQNPHMRDLLQVHAICLDTIGITYPVKSIFNSGGEFNLYNVLSRLFPSNLIYPNMALQTIFDFNDMKRMLIDRGDFNHYMTSMVDICIISTETCYLSHWPVMGIEVDSPCHDNKRQQIRDERKNRIFEIGGVPLLRIRIDGNSAPKEVCRQLCEAIEAEVNHRWATDNAGLGVYWDTLKGALSRLSNEVA